MKKLQWHYDKKNKQWYVAESLPWTNDGFTIKKIIGHGRWVLSEEHEIIGIFQKLQNAKQVAFLLRHG